MRNSLLSLRPVEFRKRISETMKNEGLNDLEIPEETSFRRALRRLKEAHPGKCGKSR